MLFLAQFKWSILCGYKSVLIYIYIYIYSFYFMSFIFILCTIFRVFCVDEIYFLEIAKHKCSQIRQCHLLISIVKYLL